MGHRSGRPNRTIQLDPRVRERLEGEFQREFFEAAIAQDPCNLDCLIRLGDIYTRQGDYEKGLSIDQRLVGLCPTEPTFHYNLACSFSLLGRLDDAIAALRAAIERGYDEWEHMDRDEDLGAVRAHEAYRPMIEAARGDA
jgi:tetratricopeptide (TPR) repeat protein